MDIWKIFPIRSFKYEYSKVNQSFKSKVQSKPEPGGQCSDPGWVEMLMFLILCKILKSESVLSGSFIFSINIVEVDIFKRFQL